MKFVGPENENLIQYHTGEILDQTLALYPNETSMFLP